MIYIYIYIYIHCSVIKVSEIFFLENPGGFKWSGLTWDDLEPSYVWTRTQLLDDLRNRRIYWKLKEEAEDWKRWRRQFIFQNSLDLLISSVLNNNNYMESLIILVELIAVEIIVLEMFIFCYNIKHVYANPRKW